MTPFRFPNLIAAAAIVATRLALTGCASAPGAMEAPGPAASEQKSTDTANVAAAVAAGVTAGNAASARPGASPASVAQAAGAAAAAATGPKPFADVIKDAKEMTGLFRLWQKDEKIWIEIAPEQFDQLYFFSPGISRGIGEGLIYGGMMGSRWLAGVPHIVSFRKVGTSVQLLARNEKFTAKAGTPEARAVAMAFSDSLLASTPVASQPHPERKSVLIDANALLVADIPAGSAALERAFRQPYAFDPRNSSLDKVRALPDMVTFSVNAHYALARMPVPPLTPPPVPLPEPPSTVPDVRSLFIGYHYSLAKLPDVPMRPRFADDRIGYFVSERFDYTSDTPRLPIVRYVDRWRLEKKDPAAAMSEPVKPIVYWIDRSVPERYRPAIRDGILEWNKAFEKIGYKDAVRVEIQPDDADFDTSDLRHASVRWITPAQSQFGAIGPRHVDPRTGEILDADIGVDANSVRAVRSIRAEYITPPAMDAALSEAAYCMYGMAAAEEAGFALNLLEARGELDPDSPAADAFVMAYLRDVMMHEVGHTLGLRHNFRASTIYSDAQLADPAFTKANGISGSVMEYNPWNLALKGAKQGAYQMQSLGPYDYWAVEYGYREIAPEQEAAELANIAGRSNEPLLAFATDEDTYNVGLDPAINIMDLGQDPLTYAQKRLTLVRELWQRTETRTLTSGQSYSVLRRNFTRGMNEANQGVQYAAKYIGGLTILRDHAGSGRVPLDPVTPEKQRAALNMLAKEVLAADSFRFSPDFLRRLSVSRFDIDDAEGLGRPRPAVDVAIDQQVLTLQRSALSPLMSDAVAQRLLNNASKVSDPRLALQLPELYATVHSAVWSELKTGKDITLFRRNLQREHANKLATALVRPSASMPADARSLLRADAKTLRAELGAAQSKNGYSPEAKAHLAETISTLDEALKAPLMRQGV